MRGAELCSRTDDADERASARLSVVRDQAMNEHADLALQQSAGLLAGLLPELLAQPLAAGPLVRLGEVYSNLGDAAAARACFERAAGIDGANSEAANNLGVLAFSAGDVDRAEWYFQRAMELDPDNAAARENYSALAAARALAPNEPRDGEIIIYQMGKVASTALNHALAQRGLTVEASHFLGAEAIATVGAELTMPWLDAYFTHHIAGQLVRNLVLTRKLNWFRECGTRRGRRLKIITLARDPLAWYAAYFIQGYEGYRQGVEAWRESIGKLPAATAPAAVVADFQRAVQARLLSASDSYAQSTPGHGYDRREPGASAGAYAVAVHARMLARPLHWFDVFLRPVLGVDVYAQAFDTRRGWSVIAGEFADVLVVKFERLGELAGVIGDFAGVEGLVMDRENVTSEKSDAADIKAAIRAAYTDELRHAIYASRYCQHFGYAAAPAVQA